MLSLLEYPYKLIANLLYGSGLRLLECLKLRIQNIDLSASQIVIRNSKGHKDRITLLPKTIENQLKLHFKKVKSIHNLDLSKGYGSVQLPFALSKKYPNASKNWSWQWVFPATSHYFDKETKTKRRHHLHESAVQKKIKVAVQYSEITKKGSCHTFRHSFAVSVRPTHLERRREV